jgi:hypothetical protein
MILLDSDVDTLHVERRHSGWWHDALRVERTPQHIAYMDAISRRKSIEEINWLFYWIMMWTPCMLREDIVDDDVTKGW